MNNVNNKKPEPLFINRPAGRLCPICSKRTYSPGGIHPQCAVQQADAPRQLQLAAAKRKARLLTTPLTSESGKRHSQKAAMPSR